MTINYSKNILDVCVCTLEIKKKYFSSIPEGNKRRLKKYLNFYRIECYVYVLNSKYDFDSPTLSCQTIVFGPSRRLV